MRCVSQTTNLGVRSSNLFGRATKITHFLNFTKCVLSSGQHRVSNGRSNTWKRKRICAVQLGMPALCQ